MSDRQDRLESLFHRALERSPVERRALLERAAVDDAALAAEVGELLDAHGEAPSCLQESRVGAAGRGLADGGLLEGYDEAFPGARLDRYEILGFLGEGGMGSVHAARQLEPFEREVAIKLIKPGMDTREVLARFEAERRLLSRLHHPHIAGVLDAGATPRGRPYFVMEHVHGEPIMRFADRRRLGLAERLELMVTVADAIQHAHGQGVIHRDLKPGNVLVDELEGRPRPRVIDFGVAKVVSGADGPRTLCTRQGQLIGTPGYMSPEQAAGDGDRVDARSDVFSLGVMLFELVSGVAPIDAHDLRGLDDQAIRRRLVQRDIPAPSRKLADLSPWARRRVARRRGLDPRGHQRALAGDLDWIVLKALAPDPDQRYDSASALAADLRAHLALDPIAAGPPGLAYRLGKLSRRHRAPFAAAAALLLAMVSAPSLLAWWQSDRIARLEQRVAGREGTEPARRPGDERPLDGRSPNDTTCASCSDAPAGDVSLVRNVSGRWLEPGEVVALAGAEGVDADRRLAVVPAHEGSPHALLGALVAAVDTEGGHVHGHSGPVAPGGVAWVVTRGSLVELAVDGPVPAQAALGLSTSPGLSTVGRADGPLVGTALVGWAGPGPGRVLALVSPSFPRPEAEPEQPIRGGVAGGGASPSAPGAAPVAQADDRTPGAGIPDAPLVADGEGPGGGSGGQGGPGGGKLTLSDVMFRTAAEPRQTLVAAAPGSAVGTPASGAELVVGDGRSRGMDVAEKASESPPGQASQSQASGTERRFAPLVWHDLDGDGVSDLLITREGRSRLLHQSPAGRFTDVTDRLTLGDSFFAGSAVFDDLDGDGVVDLIALDAFGGFVLRGGLGGFAFAERLPGSGLESIGGLRKLTPRDIDGDGRPDLVATGDHGPLLIMNRGALRFEIQPLPDATDDSEQPVPADVGAFPPTPGPGGR